MKNLTFKDGSVIELADVSTRNNYVTVVKKWADIDKLNITAENVEGATFEEETLENTVFLGAGAQYDGSNITLTITCRDKTELELLKESQAEQDAIISVLIEGV